MEYHSKAYMPLAEVTLQHLYYKLWMLRFKSGYNGALSARTLENTLLEFLVVGTY